MGATKTLPPPVVSQATWWMAVRKDTDNGREWLCPNTLGINESHVKQRSQEVDARHGREWAESSPVVRIVQVEIREVRD